MTIGKNLFIDIFLSGPCCVLSSDSTETAAKIVLNKNVVLKQLHRLLYPPRQLPARKSVKKSDTFLPIR